MTAIKLDSGKRVKPRNLYWVVLVFFLLQSFAGIAADQNVRSGQVIAEDLPDIEARTFNISPERKSRSGKTYLFNDVENTKPHVGRILLLKTLNDPVMAFRVLKQYPAKKQFAAKAVKVYGRVNQLNIGQAYIAVEKLADIVPPPITESEQSEISELEGTGAPPATEPLTDPLPPVPTAPAEEITTPPAPVEPPSTMPSPAPAPSQAPSPPPLPAPPPVEPPPPDAASAMDDLSKLEGEPPPPETKTEPVAKPQVENKNAKSFDQELDSGSSPQPQENEEQEAHDDSGEPNVIVEETPIFDPYINSLSFAFGFYRVVANGNLQNPAVGGLRYGKTIGNNILVRKPTLQDSFAVEGGLFFYKALNIASDQADDAYFVAPLAVTGRYNLLLSDTFGFFVYAGLQKGIVLSAIPGSTPATESNNVAAQVLSDLNAIGPALGIGLFFQVGPNWDFRADLGFEMISLGLMLRF